MEFLDFSESFESVGGFSFSFGLQKFWGLKSQ